MERKRMCPLCQGNCQVLYIDRELVLLDKSDIRDCPACFNGEILVYDDIPESENEKVDSDILKQFENFCAI